MVAVAAFIFGSGQHIDWSALVLMAAGLWLVVGASCALNNIYDRFIDAKMERTKNRAVAAGRIAPRNAGWFAAALMALGVALLYFTTPLALYAALAGAVIYTLMYTPLKHRSGHALWAGAAAGAAPPLVGYVAALQGLDWAAAGLFAFLFLWQIPHFIAIAQFRYDDYERAGVPLIIPPPTNEAGRRRSRKVFYASLVVLLLFCAGLIAQRWMRYGAMVPSKNAPTAQAASAQLSRPAKMTLLSPTKLMRMSAPAME